MYNYESKYKKDTKTTIKYIATYGTCDFICWDCEIEKQCEEYNHKDSSPDLDQKDFRMKAANEFLMRKNKC